MSGYSEGGASASKKTLKTWHPRHYSPLSDIEKNLHLLRDRAYDLTINSPLGASAISTESTGVLGAGLKLYPKIKFKELGLKAEEAREWARQVQLEFEFWAQGLKCDYYQRNNFYEIQRVLFNSYLADGDSFCLFRRQAATKDNPYTLRLQSLSAQRVSNPQDKGTFSDVVEGLLENGNRVINGIEVTRSGKMVAIWVANRIWNEPRIATEATQWQRVRIFGAETGLRNVLHICYDTAVEQYRGVPFLAPVIETLKQVSRYSDAELTSAVIKSFFSLFFIQPASNFEFKDVLPEDETPLDVREYKLGAGTLNLLPRGVDVKAVDRSNAQSTFDPFISHFVRQVSSALNLPEEIVSKHFQSSYSAARASLLLAQDEFRIRRESFINDFCQPVYEAFLIEAIGRGRINAAGFFEDPIKRYCWSRADWRNEQTHSIDESRELKAAQMRIELGLSTRSIEAARQGTDFYENLEELKIEEKAMSNE